MTRELLERFQSRANIRYNIVKGEVTELQKQLMRKEYELEDLVQERIDLADCLTNKLYE